MNANDVMVDEVYEQGVQQEASRFRRAATAAGTATAKAGGVVTKVVTHSATTHSAATGLGLAIGWFAGREFGLGRAGHLKRVFTGKPGSAKSLWNRIFG